MPDLCQYPRPEDNARCVLNADHAGNPPTPHALIPTQLDPRLHLLDDLAEAFRKAGEWAAYHHVRAVAHGLNFHLTGCTNGLKIGTR